MSETKWVDKEWPLTYRSLWTSAMIEAEGWIGIWRTQKRPQYALEIEVTNSDTRILQRLKLFWGGSIRLCRKKTKRWKPLWRWRLCGRAAGSFLTHILPAMTAKRQRAALGIQFAMTIGSKGERLSSTTKQTRQKMYNKMKQLNQKGPKKIKRTPSTLRRRNKK